MLNQDVNTKPTDLNFQKNNTANMNNNILINKNIISDILTSNQVSVHILNRYSRSNRSSSQSIQIFKMNGDNTLINGPGVGTNKKNEAKNNENCDLKPQRKTNNNFNFNQVIELNKSKSSQKANHKALSIQNSPKEEDNKTLNNNLSNNFSSKSIDTEKEKKRLGNAVSIKGHSVNSSSININLSERISKIENKLHNLNTKVNKSQIFNNSNNINLDSRVKSLNDVSQYEESKIIKNKSFLSYNN